MGGKSGATIRLVNCSEIAPCYGAALCISKIWVLKNVIQYHWPMTSEILRQSKTFLVSQPLAATTIQLCKMKALNVVFNAIPHFNLKKFQLELTDTRVELGWLLKGFRVSNDLSSFGYCFSIFQVSIATPYTNN